MEKTKFNNQLFLYLLIAFIIVLLGWNAYVIVTGNIMAVISIIIPLVVLFLIFDKNKYAKNGINIWSIIIMIGSLMSITGRIIKIMVDENVTLDINKFIKNSIILTIGALILYFTKTTVSIEKIDMVK